MHGARQDRVHQGNERTDPLAAGLDHEYVDPKPANSSETTKAKKPLADAKIEITPDLENPGYYSARFFLRPHFQLEGMDIGLSLVSRVRSNN